MIERIPGIGSKQASGTQDNCCWSDEIGSFYFKSFMTKFTRTLKEERIYELKQIVVGQINEIRLETSHNINFVSSLSTDW